MAFQKLERSCRTPDGWRLATVEEAKHNLDSIKRDNLLGEWDTARLLNGWIGGARYDFNVQEGFRSCLGYMLVVQSPTPEILNTDDRNRVLYSGLPELSREGRSAALLLCCEDWNKEVLFWLIPGETEEDHARDIEIWKDDEIKAASELVSAIARGLQSVRAKSIAPRTEYSPDSLKVLRTDIQESLKALAVDIQESEQGKIINESLKDSRLEITEFGDKILDDMGLTEDEIDLQDDLKMFQAFGFDKSAPSNWKAIADKVWYVAVDTVAGAIFLNQCGNSYCQLVMHVNPYPEDLFEKTRDSRSILALLIAYAYKLLHKTLTKFPEVIEAAANEVNGDCKQFDEVLHDQGFRLFSRKGTSDALSTFLVQAAKKGDVNLVKCLIGSGVQLSETDKKGKTALHYAAKLDDESSGLEIAKLLFKATEESLANEVDSEKSTPLHTAVYEEHAEMCKLLLEKNASMTSQDKDGRTPLHYAFSGNQQNEEVFRVLVSVVREDSVEGSVRLVDVEDNEGYTPLSNALIYNTPVNMVAQLLSLSRQPESYFKDLQLSLYLREYSRMGHVDLVQKLLDGGANPFDPDDEGKTALHYAAEGESGRAAMEIIGRLVFDKFKGNTNWGKASAADKYGRNVLHVAAFLGRKELCHWLLERNRNLIDSKDRDGQSAMYYAVAGAHDDPNVLDFLFERKEARNQVFLKDYSQTTPLHVAAARGNLKMVGKLLSLISREESNKYVEEADVLSQTALHRAASGGHKKVVKKLLDSGAHSLKERDCNGKTALHFAAQADGEHAVAIAKLLLDRCESDKQKSLLLFASAVGIGKPNPLLDKYLEHERRQIRETLRQENLVRVAARLGDIDMTREFITKGANIALIHNEKWIATLSTDEKENVRDVLEGIKNIVEQGTDKPALEDNLGRSPFAIGLAALFLNPFMKSPITVGISGEWGMGKSSVMLQTESILVKTAAQLAFINPFQENDITEAGESKLSVTGKARRRKIATAIQSLEAKRWIGLTIVDNIFYSVKRAKNFTVEVSKAILPESKKQAEQPDPQQPSQAIIPRIFSNLRKFWSVLRALWEESAPFDLPKFNKFLEKKYELKYHQILKSLAVIDRHDMFEEDEESGSGYQTVGEMPSEEYSLQGITPSILIVQYNAWHYRNETEAWAGLAVKITEEFEATMTVAHKLRTSWIYNWKNSRDSICLKVIFPFFLALVVAIFLSIIGWFVFSTAHNNDIKKLKYGGLPASMIVAAWGLGKSVISFVKPISCQVVDYICLPDHSQKLGYHQKVIDDINFLKEQLHYKRSWKWELFAFMWCCITFSWDQNYVPGSKIPKMPPAFSDNLRIIVFVDDLDRCEENVILQVLSAVNLVLATCQINVILSMENSMIQRAIIRKYGNNNSRANNKSNENLADKYLRKIIQLPLHLPDPSVSESNDFLQRQLGMRDSRKGSTLTAAETEKYTAYGRKKANPKFQIGTSIPEKPKLGRRETKKFFAESGAKQQRSPSFPDTALRGTGKTEQETTEKAVEGSGVEAATTVIDMTTDGKHPIKRDEQGDKDIKDERSLSTIISAMLIPKYSDGESHAFLFLHTRCTGCRKLPREWKCFMAYHRLAWNILSLSPDVIPVEGWQVQLIAWIFVCWEWRNHMTILINKWNNLGVLKKWIMAHDIQKGKEKAIEETSGPSLREIVENYIDETWPADKKSDNSQGNSATKMEDDAIYSIKKDVDDNCRNNTKEVKISDSLIEENMTTICAVDDKCSSSTKEVKISDSLPEENMTTIFSEEDTKGDDCLKEVLRKVLKEQEEMREVLRKVLKEQEEMLKMMKKKVLKEEEDNKGERTLQQDTTVKENQKVIIKKVFIDEEGNELEGDCSLQQYTTAYQNEKSEKDEEEREEWNKLRETLRVYNVSMDGIQAFQKFRFYCQPGYLPWPLPKQA